MLKPIFYKTNAGHYLVVKRDGSVIVEIDGQLRHFNEPVDYRDFVHDRAQWLMIEDEKTIADLTKMFLLNVSGRTARDVSAAPPTSEDGKRERHKATEANQKIADPSRSRKNIAIVCRTLVIILIAWILVRATWPSEFLASRFADLTVGGALAGILWLVVSLCIAVMLLAYALRLPIRRRQFDFWCAFWINTAVIIGG